MSILPHKTGAFCIAVRNPLGISEVELVVVFLHTYPNSRVVIVAVDSIVVHPDSRSLFQPNSRIKFKYHTLLNFIHEFAATYSPLVIKHVYVNWIFQESS